jgi:RNase P subunit RPR2
MRRMAGSKVADIGVVVTCPGCGQEVMQKGMIPVLQAGERRYLCKECARALIPAEEPSAGTPPPDPEPAVPTPRTNES